MLPDRAQTYLGLRSVQGLNDNPFFGINLHSAALPRCLLQGSSTKLQKTDLFLDKLVLRCAEHGGCGGMFPL
jgi:hypothetical protein